VHSCSASIAKPLGLTIGVENHLDFTTEELRDLIVAANSPRVGVIFDVGNTLGTLDEPTEAQMCLARMLSPRTIRISLSWKTPLAFN
jgi:hypothetical protein